MISALTLNGICLGYGPVTFVLFQTEINHNLKMLSLKSNHFLSAIFELPFSFHVVSKPT